MSVSKITTAPKNEDIINKINEVIDNLDGANKDLSNLSSTGEAHFLKNTATGASDLTILGNSANIDGYSINIGHNSKVTSAAATAIGYNSKAGHLSVAIGNGAYATGTSAYQIGRGTNSTDATFSVGFETGLGAVIGNYQLLDGTTGLIPDARISSNIERTSNKVTSISSSSTDTQYPSAKLLYDQLALKQDSLGFTPANQDLSNLSSTGQKVIDGQWVQSYHAELTTATSAGSNSVDISSYLPNDNYDYEVMFWLEGQYKSDAGYMAIGDVASPYTNECIKVIDRVRSSGTQACTQGMIPIKASNRVIYVQRSVALNAFRVDMMAYRRIGTNS